MKNVLIVIIMVAGGFVANAQGEGVSPSQELPSPLLVVKTFLTAYIEHDHDKFVSYLHPDIVWIQPGNNRISGVKKSKVELLEMGKKMSELSMRTLKLEDIQFFAPNGNTVVCILHWTASQPTGNVLDVHNIDEYTVENGKIVLARIYSENIDKENSFWGK